MKYFVILLILIGFVGIIYADESPVPEPEQDIPEYQDCGPGTTYQDGICVLDKTEKESTGSTGIWGTVLEYPVHRTQIENIGGVLYYVSEPFEVNSQLYDVISFYGVSFTSPYTTDPPRYIHSDVIFPDESQETLSVLFDEPDFTEHVKPQAGLAQRNDGYHFLVSVNLKELSPLKQWKQGLSPTDFYCSDGRFLMINPNDEKPACLFSSHAMIRFAENGWIPIRNFIFENTTETFVSGHGGDFGARYFSYFEINDENSILLHDKNNKTLVNEMYSGEKLISKCLDVGEFNEITILTLKEVNFKENTATFTQEKQTWRDGFCGDKESILDLYYARFFAKQIN